MRVPFSLVGVVAPIQRDRGYLAARVSHDTTERELPARTGEGRQLHFEGQFTF